MIYKAEASNIAEKRLSFVLPVSLALFIASAILSPACDLEQSGVTKTPTAAATSKKTVATSTPYVIREYPEKQADGSIALVTQWSNGRYTKKVVEAAPAPPGGTINSTGSLEIRGLRQVECLGLYLVGELVNTGTQAIPAAQVRAVFRKGTTVVEDYDASTEPIGGEIPAKGKLPFRVSVPREEYDTYELSPRESRWPFCKRYPGLEITRQEMRNGLLGREIVGEVRNNTGMPLKDIWIIMTGYDAAGNVVLFGFTLAKAQELASGEGSLFELSLWPWKSIDLMINYELQVLATAR